MKFTLNSSELLKKLQMLNGIINSSNAIPILDCFLFEFKNNSLEITASDIETTISTTMDVFLEKDLTIAVDAKLLIEIIKSFSQQPLEFEIQQNNTVEIKTLTGVYQIAYQEGDSYPRVLELEKNTNTIIPSDVLASAINKTLFATGNDGLRPTLTGILFQLSPSGLTFVATDAHRLVKYNRLDVISNVDVDFIIPKKPLSVLKNIISTLKIDVSLEYNKSNAVFLFDHYKINCRLVEGKYPNYEAVIPKENPNKLIIDRNLLLQSVKRVSTFTDKTSHQIKFTIAGQELQINGEDRDYSNKADERLTCNYEGNDMQIGFNAKFLTEALSNLQSENIQIQLSKPERAGILTPVDGECDGEKNLILVMPVKLS